MPGLTDNTAILLLTVIAAFLGGALFCSWLRHRWQRWQGFRRMCRGRRGEQQAARLLQASGFRVLSTQPAGNLMVRVDGKPVPVTVRADYLVSCQGKTYVAEVKTGKPAPRPTQGDIRRQLLEYSLVYAVDGVLYVDMARGKIQRIVFEYPQHQKS
ncbi:MAG: hypothetical protein PHC60_02655 [Heliobacteriaceae bacterium]|nr:hypothetical protein [Heliobacteriaceae bacterium]MDD4587281.1 hypothetical protein [Heliobacteriaceae bacterium]